MSSISEFNQLMKTEMKSNNWRLQQQIPENKLIHDCHFISLIGFNELAANSFNLQQSRNKIEQSLNQN